ncbi:MAG: complex I subunit 5 family protein [Eubacteriales bacterium]
MSNHIEFMWGGFCNLGLHFELSGFSVIYGIIATFMWVMALLFSKEYMAHYQNKGRYYVFTVLTYFATIGVLLSADLYTTFIFFEIMSITSYIWVVQDERKESLRAGETYLAIALIGGLVMLMGLFLLYDMIGTLEMSELLEACKPFLGTTRLYVAGGCILFGFGAKAGLFPLHVWLPKAHPVAPAPVSALLSGMLTKTGVFGVIVISTRIFYEDVYWATLMLSLGVVTMFCGAILALFSNNLKRTLACSSMSQIGFIAIGIGMQGLLLEERGIAIWGTFLHMINHSIIKLVLFIAAGIVFMNTHKLDLNEIRGFGRNKVLLKISFLLGALGIGGIPGFNGYISKTLLHESIVEYIHLLEEGHVESQILGLLPMEVIEWIFLLSGGITIAYMTKLYIAIFVERNNNPQIQEKFDQLSTKYMSRLTSFTLLGSAVCIPIIGLFSHQVAEPLAIMAESFMNAVESPHHIAYFAMTNLKGAIISSAIGAIIYVFVVRKFMLVRENQIEESPLGVNTESGNCSYVDLWPKKMDLENMLYRPVILVGLNVGLSTLCRIMDRLGDRIIVTMRKTIYKDSKIPQELPEGNAATHFAGCLLQGSINILNKTIWMDRPYRKPVEHKISVLWDELQENNTIIARSLSFGLMMVSLGIMMVFIYLLILV